MLQAVARQKARSFLLGGSLRVPREDIMTSGVFGCLSYFRREEAGVALSWLFPELAPSATFEGIEFWPRPQRDRSEPDAIIRWRASDGTQRAFLVEAKYGVNRLGHSQIERQWLDYGESLERSEKRSVVQVLIVQHAHAVDRNAAESHRTAIITWRELRDSLFHRAVGEPSLVKWASDVVSFIELGGDRPFVGWSPIPVISRVTPPIFYRRS